MKNTKKYSKKNFNENIFPAGEKGLTVVELLVSVAIMTLIVAAIAVFQKDIFSVNRLVGGRLTVQQEVRKTMKTMSAELRSASPSSLGGYTINAANSTSLIFYSDINNDNLKERVRYFLSGNILKKGVIKPSGNPLVYNPANEELSDLINYVANGTTPIFDYFDANYDGTTAPLAEPVDILAIRLVRITVIIDQNTPNGPAPATITTQVSIRNLKDNL